MIGSGGKGMYNRSVKGNTIVFQSENGKVLMSMKEELSKEKDHWLFVIAGRIHGRMGKQFIDELEPIINTKASISLDFSDVNYIESDALKKLLEMQKQLEEEKRGFIILSPNHSIMEQLKDIGFDKILNIK